MLPTCWDLVETSLDGSRSEGMHLHYFTITAQVDLIALLVQYTGHVYIHLRGHFHILLLWRDIILSGLVYRPAFRSFAFGFDLVSISVITIYYPFIGTT